MKMLLVLPGAASQKKQSCFFPNHRYLFPPLLPVPPQAFVQEGSEGEQTIAMNLGFEENKAWTYLEHKQVASVEESGWHSFSLECLWKSGFIRSPRSGVLLQPYQVCVGSWESVWPA